MRKSNKTNIVLIGMPGSGKTTLGRALAQGLKMDFYDVDEYIEIREGRRIPEIFSSNGEGYFRRIESQAVEEIAKKENAVISTGGGIVLDKRNISALTRRGVVFFINRPIEKIARDINISERPLLAKDREKIYNIYKERLRLYKEYSCFEIVNDHGIEEAVKEIAKIYNGR